ncbi:hypothetical protein LX32DRAFT_510072, partial [Colletotrichum zoysiae]
MTPQLCIGIAQGRRYSGVYFDTCYGSDSLEATEFVPGDTCTIPCPGDNSQICGGNGAPTNGTRILVPRKRPQMSRRSAPANVLLTVYQLVIGLPGTTMIGDGTAVVVPPSTLNGPSIIVPGPGAPFVPPATISAPLPVSGTTVSAGPTSSVGPDGPVITTNAAVFTQPSSPPGQSASRSMGGSGGVITSVVTTITYTTFDSPNPTALVPVELCTTLYFEDCHCPTQVIPTVPMATYLAECNKCGDDGEGTVILTIP